MQTRPITAASGRPAATWASRAWARGRPGGAGRAGGHTANRPSNEISAGGVSVTGAPPVAVGQQVLLSFTLLEMPRITVRAKVSWRREPGELGLRFDSTDQRRFPVREWIENYLDAS